MSSPINNPAYYLLLLCNMYMWNSNSYFFTTQKVMNWNLNTIHMFLLISRSLAKATYLEMWLLNLILLEIHINLKFMPSKTFINQIQWIDKSSDFWIRSKHEYHSVAHCRQYLTNRIWILTQSTHVETSCLRSDDDMIPLFPQWGESHSGIEFKCYACQFFHNADRNSCCKTKQLNSIATS